MTKIFRAIASLPPIIVLHGLPGIGKTTMAAGFPSSVFLQVEDGIPAGLEISTFGLLESYAETLDAMRHLGTQAHDYQTVVLDSLDKLQPLVTGAVCTEQGYANIETPGYGRGYVLA